MVFIAPVLLHQPLPLRQEMRDPESDLECLESTCTALHHDIVFAPESAGPESQQGTDAVSIAPITSCVPVPTPDNDGGSTWTARALSSGNAFVDVTSAR